MFGKNPISKARSVQEGFLVKQVFYTIQGEGPWAGRPTIFVRFAGCNLRCFFCDTDFSGGEQYSLDALALLLMDKSEQHGCRNFVLTGGEPMLQDLTALIEAMGIRPLYQFQIETAGTVWCEGLERLMNVTTVVSPKTPKLHPKIVEHVQYWKYILVGDGIDPLDGLPKMSTQDPGRGALIARPPNGTSVNNIFVQPCDELTAAVNSDNMDATVQVALKFGYRLSIQMHKIIGVN